MVKKNKLKKDQYKRAILNILIRKKLKRRVAIRLNPPQGNLLIYLKKKKTDLKKKKLKKDQYKLAILNIFLGFAVIILMYLRCYKMALMGFGYLLIQNSSFVKETFEDYLVEKQRFHIYYKKKFPFFFYGLPVTGLGSFIGIMYTLSCIDIIFKDMISQVNATWYKASQISEFETQLYVFAFIFFSSLFIRLGISLYVIKKC